MAKKEYEVSAKWVSALIVAAGESTRMGGVDKLMSAIGGVPLIARTILAFETCDLIREIVVVTKRVGEVADLVHRMGCDKIAQIVIGGETRSESVRRGLQELSGKADYVAIHDGARPLVTAKLIAEVALAATLNGAAIAAAPVTDTVKHVMRGAIKRTVPRKTLYAAQTPQVFDVGLIKAAHQNALDKKLTLTDDAEAVEAIGGLVRIVECSHPNIKVTFPQDLLMVNAYLELEGLA
ncbi:MAG: 2-C-methyl-D-erythritol 4-phosphate cytidylyltransferase [Oscillospiraceae bacterium]|jgi:2-C-methyl-D-erythritol 4-phosphate cytidylyltransferase|nr:2-C-methyl-D-erythritol 4-phosphate cytidylyltransferase [Oscillospiraceae bacterium]